MSRLLANIASMFRSFLDHSDAYVSREFGKESEQWGTWKGQQSALYDGHFSYRFMYKLRNFMQHVDMPPIKIGMKMSIEDQNRIDISLDFDRDKLLQEPHIWKEKLAQEIERQPPLICAIATLRDWRQCFDILGAAILTIRGNAALEAARRIEAARARLGDERGKLCLAYIPPGQTPRDRLDISMEWLPEAVAAQVIAAAIGMARTTLEAAKS
jgi:hypothetical protein